MDIQAVTFDVGSTLIVPDPPVEHVFCKIAQSRGHNLQVCDISPHMDEVFDFYEEEYARDGDFWCSKEGSVEIWLDMYRFLCHLTGIERDAEGMAASIYEAYTSADSWRPYGDVRETLMQIRSRHLKTAIISNWDPALSNIIRGLQMGAFFDEIVCSADVGCRKPNPAIFQIALERLDVDPSRCLHVGDLPEADGDGAQAAGILPVIIDRENAQTDCGYLRIEHMTDLPSLMDRLCASEESSENS